MADNKTPVEPTPVTIVPPTPPPTPEKELDEGAEGGKFYVGGILVNAQGKPINEDGTLIKEGGTPVSQPKEGRP